jgi:3-deoxy-manno-octulosonate cytidylyltransferase (CMP-KDO synthetase)
MARISPTAKRPRVKIVGIIPARMTSTRFPGKPLAPILGMPMIGHVYFRSALCPLLQDVYVATCDDEIAAYTRSIGGRAVMTSADHERASDRVAEAMLTIEKETSSRIDIVVMIQGDEPMITPEMLEAAVSPVVVKEEGFITNLMGALEEAENPEDANEIKVVVDRQDFALYFSREPIPSRKKCDHDVTLFKQVCVFAFPRDLLITYTRLPKTPLEQIESIDMLRLLEHGYRVKMVPIPQRTYSVDTREDLLFVEKQMANDPLVRRYAT